MNGLIDFLWATIIGCYHQIPVTVDAQASEKSPEPKKLDLIEFDFDKFGSSEEGKRLIDKWLNDVKLANKLTK